MNCLSQLRQFIEPSLIEIEKILQVPIFFYELCKSVWQAATLLESLGARKQLIHNVVW